MSENFDVDINVKKEIGEKIVDFLFSKANENSISNYSRRSLEYFFNNYLSNGFYESWRVVEKYENSNGVLEDVLSDIESEPKFNDLNDFLIKNYLNASYVQYLVIDKKVKTTQERKNSYHSSGYSIYNQKSLSLIDLHDALIEAKLEPKAELGESLVSIRSMIYDKLDKDFPIKSNKKIR